MPGERYELNRYCLDSDCAGIAEPEEDMTEGGILRWWCCQACGMEFGYEVVPDETAAAAGTCSLGIPEATRRRFAAPVPDGSSRVFLGAAIGRRPDA